MSDNIISIDLLKKREMQELNDAFREAVKELNGGNDYYPANENENPNDPFAGLESYMMFVPSISGVVGMEGLDEELIFINEDGDEFIFCPDEEY